MYVINLEILAWQAGKHQLLAGYERIRHPNTCFQIQQKNKHRLHHSPIVWLRSHHTSLLIWDTQTRNIKTSRQAGRQLNPQNLGYLELWVNMIYPYGSWLKDVIQPQNSILLLLLDH